MMGEANRPRSTEPLDIVSRIVALHKSQGTAVEATGRGDMDNLLTSICFPLADQAALVSVRRRLRDPEYAKSDELLTSIVAFACSSVCHRHLPPRSRRSLTDAVPQRISADYASLDIHMHGIQNILAGRGGVDSLQAYTLRYLLFMSVPPPTTSGQTTMNTPRR